MTQLSHPNIVATYDADVCDRGASQVALELILTTRVRVIASVCDSQSWGGGLSKGRSGGWARSGAVECHVVLVIVLSLLSERGLSEVSSPAASSPASASPVARPPIGGTFSAPSPPQRVPLCIDITRGGEGAGDRQLANTPFPARRTSDR